MKYKHLFCFILVGMILSLYSSFVTADEVAQVPPSQPMTTPISYESLRIMAYSGQTKLAIKLAEEYLKTHENPSVRILLARMLSWEKQYSAARDQLQYVLSNNPDNYDAGEALADIEVWSGNYQRAIDIINNVLKYNPNNANLIEKKTIIKVKMLAAAGQLPEAILLAQDYLKTHDTAAMRILYAQLLMSNKQYETARAELNKVLQKRPGDTDAIDAMINLEIITQNYQQALQWIAIGEKYYQRKDTLYEQRKLVMEKMNPKLAQQTITNDKSSSFLSSAAALLNANAINFTQSSATNPVIIKPTSKLPAGLSFEDLQKMSRTTQRSRAIQIARQYLKTQDNSDVRLLLSLMLSWEKNYDEARKNLQYLLKKNPRNIDASTALANVELWSGHKETAITIINQALKYQPNNAILLKQKQLATAKAETDKPAITYEQIKKLALSGQREKAKQLAQTYLKANENADIRVLLGLMYSWDKNFIAAKQQFEIVLKQNPRYVDASQGLANIEMWDNHYQQALSIINRALRYNPNNKNLLQARSTILEKFNQLNTASGATSILGANYSVPLVPPGKKKNAILFNYEESRISDLKQWWRQTSIGYERYTFLGPFIISYLKTYRYNKPGKQYIIDAYPSLFKGSYMYLSYATSRTSYLPRNYYAYEPFISLPRGFEFSAGQRILVFSTTTRLFTASIAKYIGNYWFLLRTYRSNAGSKSYFFTARRYFSTAESYISLTVGGGSGPSNWDFTDPDSISSTRSRSVRLFISYPVTKTFVFITGAQYSKDHFPNANIREQTDMDAGFIYYF